WTTDEWPMGQESNGAWTKIVVAGAVGGFLTSSLRLMQTHGPKRIYTPQSLEFWFDRLETDWEGHFDETHIARGRSMYCDGEIREIELGARDAIIHRKVDKKEEYAVIEWEEDRMRVRSSSTDEVLANAI